jgi:hypothetical protein
MSNILKGLNEGYFSRDEQDQQNAMDTRRSTDLSRERNAGLNEPDELSTTPAETRNGVYEYNVPAGQEKIAKDLGLDSFKGHWFSRVPVQRADFQFGRPQFHEIPSQGVAEGSKEQEYGPEWDEKIKRLGQMAKQGERKTVWDPVKRVYKTVPVNPPNQQGVAEGSATQWEVSFDYGPHMSKTVTVKAGSKQEARAKVEKAAEKSYTRGIMINWVKPAKQGVAEGQHSCPHCGGEMVSEELMNEKKDACYYKVKSRYKVWPSAYASGALVKCRNKGAKNWGNSTKNESSILEGINRADESLHDWFNKEKWVRMDTKGNIKGPCAKEPGEGKPKCLPQTKAHSLGKKGRASAAARKRREDPNPDRSGKAINVNTKKQSNEGVAEGQLDEKWSQKYKDSINCSNPKGFSQKAHCQGKNK